MRRNRCDKIWFAVSVFSFLLLAVSFLLMPLGEETDTELSTYALVAGGVFWGALLLGIVTQCVLAHRRRAWYAKRRNKRMRTAQKIGLISFFKNKPAAIADVALLLSLIGLITVLIVTHGFGYICFVWEVSPARVILKTLLVSASFSSMVKMDCFMVAPLLRGDKGVAGFFTTVSFDARTASRRAVRYGCHFFVVPQRNGERKGTKGCRLWKLLPCRSARRNRRKT